MVKDWAVDKVPVKAVRPQEDIKEQNQDLDILRN
jgi:hypothetical protein